MKEKFYYFNELKNGLCEDYLDSIKFELDRKIYCYGDQFKHTAEKLSGSVFGHRFKKTLVDFYKLSRDFRLSSDSNKNYAVTSAYFGLENYLNTQHITAAQTPWAGMGVCNWPEYRKLREYQAYLNESDILTLTTEKAQIKYNQTLDVLRSIYSKAQVKYLFVPQDATPLERMSVKIFKELGKKSFVFLHGLPGRYNNVDDNRADYLIVWGDKIKEQYIKAGVNAEKVYISGHPKYNLYNLKDLKLRNGLDNILVISKSMNGAQHSDAVRLTDRGNLILYLWQIQEVLKNIGVKAVRFRPHPSENIEWYYRHIDRNFFIPDTERQLVDSLKKTSLVIGPTSSVFFDSLFAEVNYVVYEPVFEGLDVINFPLVAPFDLSDNRVVSAQTKEELKKVLMDSKITNLAIIKDYVNPIFNLDFMKSIL